MKLIIVVSAFTLTVALAISSAGAHGWCWACNQDNTYGWQLMTPDERKEHQFRLVSFTEYTACKEYVDAHQKKMEGRAREKGVEVPVIKENPCDAMKAKELLK